MSIKKIAQNIAYCAFAANHELFTLSDSRILRYWLDSSGLIAPIPTMAGIGSLRQSITSRTLFHCAACKGQFPQMMRARSGAGIILTLQAASSWPIPVICTGPTPPDNVTSRFVAPR